MNKEKMIEINIDRVFDLAGSLSTSTSKKRGFINESKFYTWRF